jgi:hypothetical protein
MGGFVRATRISGGVTFDAWVSRPGPARSLRAQATPDRDSPESTWRWARSQVAGPALSRAATLRVSAFSGSRSVLIRTWTSALSRFATATHYRNWANSLKPVHPSGVRRNPFDWWCPSRREMVLYVDGLETRSFCRASSARLASMTVLPVPAIFPSAVSVLAVQLPSSIRSKKMDITPLGFGPRVPRSTIRKSYGHWIRAGNPWIRVIALSLETSSDSVSPRLRHVALARIRPAIRTREYEHEMINLNGTHFHVGTVCDQPGSWMIVGLYYPRRL